MCVQIAKWRQRTRRSSGGDGERSSRSESGERSSGHSSSVCSSSGGGGVQCVQNMIAHAAGSTWISCDGCNRNGHQHYHADIYPMNTRINEGIASWMIWAVRWGGMGTNVYELFKCTEL